jgi:hypothetical protein
MSDPYSELYEQRLLVFLETAPQSNTYNQVILDQKQFKGVGNSISTFIKKGENGFDEYNIKLSEDEYKLPDLQSHE